MEMAAETKDWWKYTTTALTGVLATLASVWMSGGFDRITRAEAVELIRTNSPYVEDRRVLVESVKANTEQIRQLAKDNHVLSNQVSELIGLLRDRNK